MCDEKSFENTFVQKATRERLVKLTPCAPVVNFTCNYEQLLR